MSLRTRSPSQSGQATVEMALVLSFILAPLLAGLVNFALIFGHWQSANQKVASAARSAAVGRQLEGKDLEAWLAGGENGAPVVCVRAPSKSVGQPVTATMKRAENIFPILNLGITQIEVTARATMRIERLPASTDGTVYAAGTCS